jgi:aminoacrylate hydrolase
VTRVERADGASLSVHREGSGPILLLVSGLGGTAAFWDPLATILQRSFTVIRFDQRGIGASSRGTARCDIAALAEDARAILDALAIESAVVVGHSTGGLVAQALAEICPQRCRALVLSGSWVKADAYIETLFRSRLMLLAQAPEAYDRLALFLSYPPDWLAQRADLLKRAAQGPATCAKGRAVLAERIEALLAFDGTRALAHILMPVLVMSAADDHVIPAYHQRCLATSLARAEAQVFESGGHFFPQTRAEGFCQALGDWYWRIAASI